jgi:Holliday junction resolvase RusA-like endonuclease
VREIRFDFPELPVSVNALYFSRGGRKILTSEGRRFKNKFISEKGGARDVELMSFQADPEAPYELHLWFYMLPEKLYSQTYGKDKRVKSPFRDVDTSNMIKLVEDCISGLVGIRDRNNFSVCAHKRSADKERIIAILRPIDLESDPYEAV